MRTSRRTARVSGITNCCVCEISNHSCCSLIVQITNLCPSKLKYRYVSYHKRNQHTVLSPVHGTCLPDLHALGFASSLPGGEIVGQETVDRCTSEREAILTDVVLQGQSMAVMAHF